MTVTVIGAGGATEGPVRAGLGTDWSSSCKPRPSGAPKRKIIW